MCVFLVFCMFVFFCVCCRHGEIKFMYYSFIVQNQITVSLCLTIAIWLTITICRVLHILDSLLWGSTVGYPSDSFGFLFYYRRFVSLFVFTYLFNLLTHLFFFVLMLKVSVTLYCYCLFCVTPAILMKLQQILMDFTYYFIDFEENSLTLPLKYTVFAILAFEK